MHVRDGAPTPRDLQRSDWSMVLRGNWSSREMTIHAGDDGRRLYQQVRRQVALITVSGAATLELRPALAEGEADEQPQLRRCYGRYAKHKGHLHNNRPVYTSEDGLN
eukprot:6838131-Prymnesium_polylepis.1